MGPCGGPNAWNGDERESRLKILIVSQYFWPERFRISDLAKGLSERGHAVTVLTGVPNYPEGRFFEGYGRWRNWRQDRDGVTVIRVPLVSRGHGRGLRLALNYLSFAVVASVLGPLVCQGRYDVIFVCQLSPALAAIPGILLGRLRGIPVILWVLDLWPESLSATGAVTWRPILRSVDWMVRAIYRASALVAVASHGFAGSVLGRGVVEERIVDLPNWYEPEYGSGLPLISTDAMDALPEGFVVMFAGNVGVAQGFETILDAAERLKRIEEIHWVVIGDGRRWEWVRGEIARRGLGKQIHLLGQRAPETMPAYFVRASVMLVTLRPDPAFALTVPGKVQSYMACGRPIVGALDGEARRLIEEAGAGLVSAAGDGEALAANVLRMFEMPGLNRDRMGAAGRRYCEEHFDREKLLGRLEGWMDGLTGLKEAQ